MPHSRLLPSCLFVAGLLVASPSPAQWYPDGTPVSLAADNQEGIRIADDGFGGVLAVWLDRRNGTNWDLYVQRFNAYGSALWTTDGVPLCTATGDQTAPFLIADGDGGAFVAWWDNRAGNVDIYAQHVSSTGVMLWGSNGAVVCNDPAAQGGSGLGGVQLVPSRDETTDELGVIAVWEDLRGSGYDIYAQWMLAAGPQWTTNGVPVCAATDSQVYPQAVSDGAEGAIVVWQDARADPINVDLYAQRINVKGVVEWTVDGIAVCTAALDQRFPRAVSDGSGGMIATWIDRRLGLLTPFRAYAQRVNAGGVPQWTADGVTVHTYVEYDAPEPAADGTGGVIVTWRDPRNGNIDIFAQRLDAAGAAQWGAVGLPVCVAAGNQTNHQVAPDGNGGIHVTWESGSPIDVMVQHLDASGAQTFSAAGEALCQQAVHQTRPAVAAHAGGQASVGWTDYRNGNTDRNTYLSRVFSSTTSTGHQKSDAPLPVIASPNPFRSATDLRFAAPVEGPVTLDLFDASGRLVLKRTIGAPGSDGYRVRLDDRDDRGRRLAPGVYLCRVHAAGWAASTRLVALP